MNNFCGHPTGAVSSEHLRLEYLTDVGPRIARLSARTSERGLFAEVPDAAKDTPGGRYRFLGGHRLWHSPEAVTRTYLPDEPVRVEVQPDGVRLMASAEPGSGIAKTIHVRLSPDRPAATIRHELHNEGAWEVELAPWALTMLRMGGVAILPQWTGFADPAGLTPNRHLVLWPYTSVHDKRLSLADDFILLYAEAGLPACKIGCVNPIGWVGYWIEGTLFVKRFDSQPRAQFPDRGCNTELYCGDEFIELETLGPLSRIAPGEAVVHEELWELYDSLDQPFIPASLRLRIKAV